MSTDKAKLADCPEEGEMSEECLKAREEAAKAKEAKEKKGGSG